MHEQAKIEATEEISTPRQLLDDDLFTANGMELSQSTQHFLHLPEEFRQQIDQKVLPLEGAEQRFRALHRWAFDEFHGD